MRTNPCDPSSATPEYSVGVFHADATASIGSPVAYAPARSITDPLSARGVVILGAGAPIVICAVDWLGIGRSGREYWQTELARAAGTTADRVAVQTVHQHDAPRWDPDAEELLASHGLGGQWFDTPFATEVVARTAASLRQAVEDARPCTHLGLGRAEVDRIASNRRVLGHDGRVLHQRMSSCTDPDAIAAPEGEIDPDLSMISFWDHDTPLAVLTSYACHPQSHYGQGDVTAEWVGLARQQREDALDVRHIHFTGAAGDIAAGKYNDGSPARRFELADRLAEAMTRAWQDTAREPLTHLTWQTVRAELPLATTLDPDELRSTLADPQAHRTARIRAATRLSLLAAADHRPGTPDTERVASVEVTGLGLNDARVVFLPGEPFVAYQLRAQRLHAQGPNPGPVMVAAYGDYSFGYIGTRVAYRQGGYETSPAASNVAPEVEDVLLAAMTEALH